MTKTVSILCAALLVSAGLLSFAYIKEHSEKERFKANQTALLSQVEYWTTENEKSVAEVFKLSLTADELRNANKRLEDTASELSIKLKRMQSASTTATKTEVRIVTQIRDSIVYRDSVITPIKVFMWRDPWLSVSGAIESDSVRLSATSTDTLTTIVHKIPHKFLFIKWGCKAIKQTVISANPHSQITYNEYIEVK